ncbi:hypothetical protein OHB49_41925 [Streptomyces sp. NBC_01717]|uniref:hypothetical protein n=1 Tax=Streptomyces sp. NBC_01717 TaxID=2975918 RepID=UPI002E3063F5|nr:hypothetical protein [Streptomyces sp. NBC_01717]
MRTDLFGPVDETVGEHLRGGRRIHDPGQDHQGLLNGWKGYSPLAIAELLPQVGHRS